MKRHTDDGCGLGRSLRLVSVAVTVVSAIACGTNESVPHRAPSILRIGFGLSTSPTGVNGMGQVYQGIVLDRLVAYGADARGIPSIAERWSVSDDGRVVRLEIRHGLVFHDGRPVNAAAVRDALRERLPNQVGPVFADISAIEASGEDRVEIVLKQRSPLILEGLDILVQAPGGGLIGSGAWILEPNADPADKTVRLRANDKYYAGRPIIDGVEIRPYPTTRAAWAELLRGNEDMLYEVGADAIDSLRPSSATRIHVWSRRYVLVGIFNLSKPELKDAAFRRRLNAAVDRRSIVHGALHDLGEPAAGAVWPRHWAYDPAAPGLDFNPATAAGPPGRPPIRLRITFADAAYERLVVALQQQLRLAGAELLPELVNLEEFNRRALAGDFDILLADAVGGPTLLRPYQFWHSAGVTNWGHFNSRRVDQALASIRAAADDGALKAGVSAFQQAIVDDPPAIFVAWSERARAVSTRFQVLEEPGRDIFATLRLWKPADPAQTASTVH